ncbi:hypothetical protein DL764_002208 [Monosporascus ibericus]|uniref:Xylanolytic transcriptional activator regulatory domain-containing protein n=1 Tax=Monosporascus ibericus TaxID=155417 RepID=A0A4Q4TPT9_9PEZI|nr:hypothetical protein DL764_002208 [Monosporascus ibericus]
MLTLPAPQGSATTQVATDKKSQPITDRHPQRAPSNGKSPSAVPATQAEITNTAGRVSRFVGDMNPECMFIEVTSPHSSRDQSIRGGVGVWQSRVLDKRYSASSATRQESTSIRTTQGILKPHIQASCLPCRPPASDFAVLRRIYVEKFDPLFPAISPHLTSPPGDEISWIVIQQVVSLAAASDPESVPHLRLQNREDLLGRNEFSGALSSAIRTIIDAGFITDRVTEIRILLIFSLYMQPTCPEEADLPARAFTHAVHQMHTLGLHLTADKDRDDFLSTRSLFCCLWALDRITSSLYGRALLIHERDIGWDLDACIEAQAPPFRLFLMVVRLLDRVIDLYRPKNLLIREAMVIELPIFEQMIIDAGATKVPSAFLGERFWLYRLETSHRVSNESAASLEVLYHSVAILSCRLPPGGTATTGVLPPPAINSRRSLSADRITSIVSQEYNEQVSYMPIIPYGVSLSLSVAYRKMRYSDVSMFRNRGKHDFQKNTQLLKSLGGTFWTARVMAAMAEQVLQEMDKAVASLTSQDSHPAYPLRKADIHPADGADPPVVVPEELTHQPHNRGIVDSSFSGVIPDLDVFGNLDPTFDLDAIDAALEGNLDFGASSNWFDWQALWAPMTCVRPILTGSLKEEQCDTKCTLKSDFVPRLAAVLKRSRTALMYAYPPSWASLTTEARPPQKALEADGSDWEYITNEIHAVSAAATILKLTFKNDFLIDDPTVRLCKSPPSHR